MMDDYKKLQKLKTIAIICHRIFDEILKLF